MKNGEIIMSITYKFPENFWWGAATSGPQSEGRFNKKHASVFDYWFDTEPEKFFNGVERAEDINTLHGYLKKSFSQRCVSFVKFILRKYSLKKQ